MKSPVCVDVSVSNFKCVCVSQLMDRDTHGVRPQSQCLSGTQCCGAGRHRPSRRWDTGSSVSPAPVAPLTKGDPSPAEKPKPAKVEPPVDIWRFIPYKSNDQTALKHLPWHTRNVMQASGVTTFKKSTLSMLHDLTWDNYSLSLPLSLFRALQLPLHCPRRVLLQQRLHRQWPVQAAAGGREGRAPAAEERQGVRPSGRDRSQTRDGR